MYDASLYFKRYLWLHDFPGPNSIDQVLAQSATHNKYFVEDGSKNLASVSLFGLIHGQYCCRK